MSKPLKYVVLFSIMLSILLGCRKSEFSGYREINGNYFALLSVGDNNVKPEINDYLITDIKYVTTKDSVFFRGTRKFRLNVPNFSGSVNEIFMQLSEKDSACMVLDAKRFFEKDLEIPLPGFLKNDEYFKINCRILKIQSSMQYQKEKTLFLSWLTDQKHFEKTNMELFLGMLSNYENRKGLYKITLVNGNGDAIKMGDTITINYEGHFLDGKMFDSTWKRHQPFQFVYGTEMQVIRGLEISLPSMHENERAVFVMPSEMAFGEKGSSTRIVPPYTPVIFEVEVVNIN